MWPSKELVPLELVDMGTSVVDRGRLSALARKRAELCIWFAFAVLRPVPDPAFPFDPVWVRALFLSLLGSRPTPKGMSPVCSREAPTFD